jgi:hypothetical protein
VVKVNDEANWPCLIADMLAGLRRDHRGRSYFYYLHVPFEETMRRHATRPQAAEFGRAEMSTWYRELDLLPGGIEQVVPASSSLEATVTRIMSDASLSSGQGGKEWAQLRPEATGAGLGRPGRSAVPPQRQAPWVGPCLGPASDS